MTALPLSGPLSALFLAMNSRGTLLPRVLAVIILLVSLSMLIPVAAAAVRLSHGVTLKPYLWLTPLVLLGVGVTLTYLLSRRVLAFQVYTAAFVLWLITAAYYWVWVIHR